MLKFKRAGSAMAAVSVLALAGCGGGGGGDGGGGNPPATTYTVGGTTSGLTGTVVLRLNGGGDLNVSGASFTFTGRLANAAAYTVTVQTQPTGQTCALANATGSIAAANVSNVAVTCTNNSYNVGGNVTNLSGSIVLRLNGANDLTINASGGFTFGTQVAHAAAYTVTVQTQPAGQNCTVTNGSGNIAGANVTTVAVACVNDFFSVAGNANGLMGTVVLQLNGANDLTVTSAGAFNFPGTLAGGTLYAVTVFTQPSGQTCVVTNGSGTGAANVTNVTVTCTNNPATYTVGGTLSGLNGGQVILKLNNANDLTLDANGTFTFNARIGSGFVYSVHVATQPAGQSCVAGLAGGIVGNANVTNITVSCGSTAATYQLGGNINGLNGEIWLWLNGGNTLVVTTAGAFHFDARLASGAAYTVAIVRQPDSQVCLLGNGTGTMPAADLGNVNINCFAFSVGGTITNLNGAGLVLSLNGQTDLPIPTGNTTFTFPAGSPINNGVIYTVHIKSQPAAQTCTILRSSGLATLRQVTTNVAVTCLDNVTDSLAGTYVLTTLDGAPAEFGAVLTFHADGTYLFALRQDEVDCGANNGNGIEYGVYRWNSTTHVFALRTADIDTNGECGVSDGAATLNGTIIKNANGTLSADLLDNNGSGDHVIATFTPATSTNGSIIGSWGDNQGFILFRSDNTFYYATSKFLDNVPITLAGIEHGCYTINGNNSQGSFTTSFAAGCTPGGRPALDTTGPTVGFSPLTFPIAFSIDQDTLNGSAGPISPLYRTSAPRIKTQ